MARNKKLRGNAKNEKTTTKVNIALDPETAALWNREKKYRNMSEWIRSQIKYHFAGQLAPFEQKQVLAEEYRILAEEKRRALDRINAEYDAKIIAAGQALQKAIERVENPPTYEEIRLSEH